MTAFKISALQVIVLFMEDSGRPKSPDVMLFSEGIRVRPYQDTEETLGDKAILVDFSPVILVP